MNERFVQGLVAALAFHGALAAVLVKMPAWQTKRAPTVVEMAIRERRPPPQMLAPPPPPPKLEEPPPPKPLPKKVKHAPPPEPAKAPPPNQTPPKEPPKEPPKPVFGLSDKSTSENGPGIAMPVGNTTVADPLAARPKGPVGPLAPQGPQVAPAPVFKAASPLAIKEYPVPDDECGRIPDRLYPQDLREQGVQGTTKLKVEVDEQGHVHSVRAVSGPAKALNDIAVAWFRGHCHCKPAIGTDGKSVAAAFTYDVNWEIQQ